MGNLDFSTDPKFAWYVVFLAISGLILIVLSAAAGGTQKASARIISALFGLGFLGYAIYLAFIFDGHSYEIFFYAFILPFIIGFRFIGGIVAARNARNVRVPAAAPQPMIPPTAPGSMPPPAGQPIVDAPTPPEAPPAN